MKTFGHASQVSKGMRVITADGRRTGTVKAVDVFGNTIGVLLDGDTSVTPMLEPSGFAPSPNQTLRLTGRPPPGTVPHSV